MSVTSGFFNSVNGDRRYNAEQMSAIFNGIINDGVFSSIGTAFSINAKSGNTITVGIGRAWFNSTWVDNDSIFAIKADDAEMLLNRYDAVIIEVNHTDAVRAGSIKIIKGAAASSPVKPTLINESDIHQYPLAYIYRPAGSTEITQSNITNMIGTSSCPYITCVLQVQDIDKVIVQWEAQFNEWFDTIREQLSVDAVDNLQNQIDDVTDQLGSIIYTQLENNKAMSHIDVVKNNWNNLKNSSVYIMRVITNTTQIAIVQKHDANFGSVSFMGYYVDQPYFYLLQNGVWSDKIANVRVTDLSNHLTTDDFTVSGDDLILEWL